MKEMLNYVCFFKTTIYLGRYLCKLENKLY